MQSDDAISVMTMASMQEEHNAQVHPQWKEQGYGIIARFGLSVQVGPFRLEVVEKSGTG